MEMTRDELAAELLMNLGSQRAVDEALDRYDLIQATLRGLQRLRRECQHPIGGDPCPVCGREAKGPK